MTMARSEVKWLKKLQRKRELGVHLVQRINQKPAKDSISQSNGTAVDVCAVGECSMKERITFQRQKVIGSKEIKTICHGAKIV